MLIKFLNSESGKVLNKLLAFWLVITLTFANFIFLSLYVGKGIMSYANDEKECKLEVTQKFKTNRVYETNENEFKRYVELEIQTKIDNGEGRAEIIVPKTVIKNSEPESITAVSYKTAFSFDDNKITYNAKETNKFIVTYIYDEIQGSEEPVLESDEINVRVKLNDNKIVSAKGEAINSDVKVQFGDLVLIKETVSSIFKGNMYINKDTEYTKTLKLEVSNIDNELISKNLIINDEDKIESKKVQDEVETFESIDADINYKSTIFNKAEMLKLFNEEGYVIITATSGEKENKTVILFGEYDEEEYKAFNIIDVRNLLDEEKEIIVNYEEGTSKVTIETSIPEKEGILSIKHEKLISLPENTEVNAIARMTSVKNIKSNNYNYTENDEIVIEEPNTTAELSMEFLNGNQTVLSSIINNDVKFTISLKANSPEHKLFKNPILQINMPENVNIESLEDYSLALNDGLSIKDVKVIENSILVELSGEQTDYNNDEIEQSISIGAKLLVNKLAPSCDTEITAICKNGEDEEINLEATKVKINSPKDLIAISNVEVAGEKSTSIESNNTLKINTFEKRKTANVEFNFVNNYGEDIKDIILVGNLNGENSTFNTYLLEGINVQGLESTVKYYSGETEVESFENSTSFEVILSEMKQGEGVNISYKLNVPENLEYNQSVFNTLTAKYILAENEVNKDLNINMTTGKGPSAKIEVNSNAKNEILNGGQIVTYTVKVINDGDEDIAKAKLTFDGIENGKLITYTYLQSSNFEYVEDEDNIKEWEINNLAVGKDVECQVVVKLDNVDVNEIFEGKFTLEMDDKIVSINNIKEEMKNQDLDIKMTTYTNAEVILNEGEINQYRIEVKNVSENAIKNATITTFIPENTEFVSSYINNEEKDEKKENGKVTDDTVKFNVNRIEAGETTIAVLEVKVKELPKELDNEMILNNFAYVEAENANTNTSNILKNEVKVPEIEFHMVSNTPVNISEYDRIDYVITAKNIGKSDAYVNIKDMLPEELSTNRITYYINKENIETKYTNNSQIEIRELINPEETLTIEFTGTTGNIEEEKTINNIATLKLGNHDETIESEVVTNIITPEANKKLGEQNNNQEKNNDNNAQDEKSGVDNNEQTYSILGTVWVDENKDGKKDSKEKLIQDVEVTLVNATTGEIIKNEKGESLVVKTSKDGSYAFNNLKNGEYKVVFKYDTSLYGPTEFMKEGVNASANSDAKAQTIVFKGEKQTVALTDTIKIANSSLVNIDLGLKENSTYDLSLKKEIKKVTVKNSEGTAEYDFKNTTFAKVEIPGKAYKGSTLLIEYEITVANEGDITANITDILDYMPKDLNFNSELNTNWYVDSEGVLHDIALTMDALEPGKTLKEKLILTKTLTSDSALRTVNTAEIGSSTNAEGLKEKDSVEKNKNENEDDFGKAELIISVKTGGSMLYIGIALISLTIMTLGIYIINKKVLKVRI